MWPSISRFIRLSRLLLLLLCCVCLLRLSLRCAAAAPPHPTHAHTHTHIPTTSQAELEAWAIATSETVDADVANQRAIRDAVDKKEKKEWWKQSKALGDVLHARGRLDLALAAYRECEQTGQQKEDTKLLMAQTALYLGKTTVCKQAASGNGGASESGHVLVGMAQILLGNYSSAAKAFLSSVEESSSMGGMGMLGMGMMGMDAFGDAMDVDESQPSVRSTSRGRMSRGRKRGGGDGGLRLDGPTPADVGLYAGLCVLATSDRAKLSECMKRGSSFKRAVGCESKMQNAIMMFCSGDYPSSLAIFDNPVFRQRIAFDPIVGARAGSSGRSHFEELIAKARQTALVQYFVP